MKNIELKIVGGFFLVLITVIVIAFWRDGSKDTSREQVITNLVSDSLNSRWTAKLRSVEDSLQRAYQVRDSAWNIAYNNKKTEADKYKKQADRTTEQYNELKEKYAEPCAEVIAACDQRETQRLAEIKAQQTALTIADNRLTDCKQNSESLNRELALADSLLYSKNKAITTLKDLNTTITNRMERNWLFRNWYWIGGRWREYVLQ